MTRAMLASLAAAALLGCPLPQPLPDYPPGTITPPRILADEIFVDGEPSSARAVIAVPAGCAIAPVYRLTARIHDTNTIEQVEARWFVNYHPLLAGYYREWQSDTIPPDPDPLVLTRSVPPRDASGAEQPFLFAPYQHPPPAGAPPASGPPYPAANLLRVVELVVTNGFDPQANAPPAPLPRRTPDPTFSFETQVYRWVFLTVPEPTGCVAGDPGCCPEATPP